MELVPALFLHIQKTAGTSFVNAAREHYGHTNVITHGDFMGRTAEEVADVPFISGHFGYGFARQLMSERYSFTFLRKPVDRVLSFYYFCKRRNSDQFHTYSRANELELDEFLLSGLNGSDPIIRAHILNNQVWQLACGNGNVEKREMLQFGPDELLDLARAHATEFDHVGFTETFEADYTFLCSRLGVSVTLEVPKSNVTDQRPSATDHSSRVRDLLDEATYLDRLLYDHMWASRRDCRAKTDSGA